MSAARAEILAPAGLRRPLLGVPEVRVHGSVAGVEGLLFFELVDVAPDGTRVTLDDQTMPVRLGPGPFDRDVALHGVSWILEPGHALELEVTTGSTQFTFARTGPFTVELEATALLPVAPARFAAPSHRAK